MSHRAYIPYPERLAATLACLLPQEQRDELRAAKGPADGVIGLFQFDHLHLHALDGTDDWWNLDPKLIAPHKEKSRRDTSIVAKSKRLFRSTAEHRQRMEVVPPGSSAAAERETRAVEISPRPRRFAGGAKIRSRGFDKHLTRKFNGKTVPRKRTRT